MKALKRLLILSLLAALALPACTERSGSMSHDNREREDGMAPTNRIDIPPAVRQNLGMTFVPVEARRVAQTLRVPGRFELLPTATREYRTMLPGRVELLVDQFDRVEPGMALYRIDSPDWRALQASISDAEAQIERLNARVRSFGPLIEAHRNHERMIERTNEIRRERVAQLEGVAGAGGGRAGELLEARAIAAAGEAELAEILEKEAEIDANHAEAKAELAAAEARRGLLLESAASLLGVSVERLLEPSTTGDGSRPVWRDIRTITVRAEGAGIVDTIGLSNGGWAEQTTAVLSVVQPDRIRFRGSVLQSDIAAIRDGLPGAIVPPTPTRAVGAIDMTRTMGGTVSIAPAARPGDRTIDIYVVPESVESWARAGVTAQLEITTDATAGQVPAIPRAAVHRDGLVPVFFRRDPRDANKAIRIEGDLGIDDGRWIVVNSGLRLGDEVVLDGSYQLMLATATAGGMPKGGHFHADGTWHADDH